MEITFTSNPLDPQVRQVIQKVVDYYNGLTAFEVDVEIDTYMGSIGMANNMTGSFHIAMQRPASFSIVQTSGLLGNNLVSDGKTVFLSVPLFEQYTAKKAPDTVGEILNPMNMMMVGGIFGGMFPIA